MQKAAVQEVSGKRNGKEKRPRNCFFQNTSIRKIREDSGKWNGKGETDFQKTRSPGSSGKIPGRFPGRCGSTEVLFLCRFLTFPRHHIPPIRSTCLITGSKKVVHGNFVGKLQMTFSSRTARVSIFQERNHVGETVVSVAFLLLVSESVSRPSKSRSPGRSGKFPGRFPGRAIIMLRGGHRN